MSQFALHSWNNGKRERRWYEVSLTQTFRKGKRVERRGRKAMGLRSARATIARLPKKDGERAKRSATGARESFA